MPNTALKSLDVKVSDQNNKVSDKISVLQEALHDKEAEIQSLKKTIEHLMRKAEFEHEYALVQRRKLEQERQTNIDLIQNFSQLMQSLEPIYLLN